MGKRTEKKQKGRRKHKVTADVLAPVDATLKARWVELSKRLDALAADDAKAWDQLWEVAGRVVESDPPLYLFGGYKTPAEFFIQRMKVDRATGFRNVRVARYATPAEERIYGVTKLDAALSFIEAKIGGKLEHPPLPVAFERLRIPKGNGADARRLTLEEAMVEDVKAATRALLRHGSRAGKSGPGAVIGRALANVSALADVGVSERKGLAFFSRVPIAAIARFAAVLGGLKLDV